MVAEVGRKMSWIEKEGKRCSFQSVGYQFYTTTPNVTVFNNEKNVYPTGSLIWIKEPRDPSQLEDDELEELTILPLASFVEKSFGEFSWTYIEPTGDIDIDNNNMSLAFKTRNVWQVNGIAEHVYYKTTLDLETNELKINNQIIGPWVQREGDVSFFNSQDIHDYWYTKKIFRDVNYDLPVGFVKSGFVELNMPEESDWPDRGCITTVENEEYGNRDFFIMNTADGSWWCWPINAEKDPSISAIENISPELAAQAYTNKANIPNGNAIKIKPAYPSWCLVNENPIFKNVWESDKTKTNQPRYSWSFNSTGTKAISVMIERIEHASVFKSINYTFKSADEYFNEYIPSIYPSEPWYEDQEKTVYLEERTWVLEGEGWTRKEPYSGPLFSTITRFYNKTTPRNPPHHINEDVLKTDAKNNQSNTNTCTDRFGFIELGFNVQITGQELTDFTFTIEILNNKTPNELNTLEQGMLTQIKYAMPTKWDKTETIGEPFFYPITIQTDDILSCWIKLFRHSNEDKIEAAFDGAPSLATISRSLATIRKGLTFEKILLTLPMGQYIGDFGNGLKGPNSSLFSDEFEFSKDVYYFDAKFKNMDLSSFSFYYEVRLLNQTESDEIPIVLGHFPPRITRYRPNRWFNNVLRTEGGKVLYVCVLGRIAETQYVGSQNSLFELKIREWVNQPEFEKSKAEEEYYFNLNKKINFRGSSPTAHPHPSDIWTTYSMRGVGELVDDLFNPVYIVYDKNIPRSDVNTHVTGVNSWAHQSWRYMSSSLPYEPFKSNNLYYTAWLVDPSIPEATPTQPWWLLNACGELFFEAIQLAIFKQEFGLLPKSSEDYVNYLTNTFSSYANYVLFESPGPPGNAPFIYHIPRMLDSSTGLFAPTFTRTFYFFKDFEQPIDFESINANNIVTFLIYVYNLYDNFKLVHNYILGNWHEGYEWKSNLVDEEDITIPVFQWRYTQHPFLALYPDFNVEQWAENVKWYALKLIKNMQTLYSTKNVFDLLNIGYKYSKNLYFYFRSPKYIYPDPHDRFTYDGQNLNWGQLLAEMGLPSFGGAGLDYIKTENWDNVYYPTPHPVLFNHVLGCTAGVNSTGVIQRSVYSCQHLNLFNVSDWLHVSNTFGFGTAHHSRKLRDFIIPDYDFGQNTYNNYYLTCCCGDEFDAKSKIIVTPSGHYSYSYRGLFWFKKPVNSYTIVYMSANGKDKKLPIFYDSQPGVLNVTASDIEHKLVERIGFYFGKITTTHLNAYNKAFNTTVNYEDYKLQFDIDISGNTIIFKPFYADTWKLNIHEILSPYFTHMPSQTSGYFPDNNSNIGLTSPAIYDETSAEINDREPQLRLSPLFICKK